MPRKRKKPRTMDEVVRCAECKFYSKHTFYNFRIREMIAGMCCDWWAQEYAPATDPDDFCSKGERKSE